jgi:hypothetical protein
VVLGGVGCPIGLGYRGEEGRKGSARGEDWVGGRLRINRHPEIFGTIFNRRPFFKGIGAEY